MVYTRSALVEQTTPDAVQLSDVQVTVENLEFVDQDRASAVVAKLFQANPYKGNKEVG